MSNESNLKSIDFSLLPQSWFPNEIKILFSTPQTTKSISTPLIFLCKRFRNVSLKSITHTLTHIQTRTQALSYTHTHKQRDKGKQPSKSFLSVSFPHYPPLSLFHFLLSKMLKLIYGKAYLVADVPAARTLFQKVEEERERDGRIF